MTNIKRLLLALLAAVAFTTVGGTPASAHTCGISFASDAESLWVHRVHHHHTNMSCLDARAIYRHMSWARDDFAGNRITTSWATPLPSPAFARGGQRWCKITTVEKYRAPIVPFGDHVLFSVRMTQEFIYDGTQVSVGTAAINPDVTTNGWRYDFEGVQDVQEFWQLTPWHYSHTSEKWSRFGTDGIVAGPVNVGSVDSVLYTKIWVQANGDWATGNVNGLAGCQNP